MSAAAASRQEERTSPPVSAQPIGSGLNPPERTVLALLRDKLVEVIKAVAPLVAVVWIFFVVLLDQNGPHKQQIHGGSARI
jgi:hypothetical protein